MVKEIVTVACGQFRPEFGDTARNITRICAIVEGAEAELVALPELATSGYEFRGREEAKECALNLKSGAEIRRLKQLAGDARAHVALGLPERSGRRVFNSAVLIEPSGRTTVYRKLHLFEREKERFDPGDAPPPVVDTGVGRLGLMICFDWVFPEMARTLALRGAQVLLHPSNLVLHYCQRAMFARSVENRIFSVTCNRVGAEERDGRRLVFTGGSQILTPLGETLAQAGTDPEEIIRADLRPGEADDKLITVNNHVFQDRRPEFYIGLRT
jgi:predicted amidohydrolase